MNPQPELLILAPAAAHAVYTQNIRCFVDLGVCFPFADDYALPAALPAALDGVRCIMIDPSRRAEFAEAPQAARVAAFQAQGGLLYWPDLQTPAGGMVGDSVVRHAVLRVVNTAGLTLRNPRLLARLQALDESVLIERCKHAAPEELAFYVKRGAPFVDPVGMWTLPAAVEAAEYFQEPALADPVWQHIAQHYQAFGRHFDSHGARYLLQYAQRTGDRAPVSHVLQACTERSPWPHLWRVNGVFVNCDLKVPEGADPDEPPPAVRAQAWTWPENSLVIGETYPMLTAATGDPRFLDVAVRHLRGAHHWLFEPQSRLYWHVGRPAGPDRRSAPWARGDSHFLWGVRCVLDQMPETHPQRRDLVDMLRLNLDGLLHVQNTDGLWLNVLDATPEESRTCSSATSQFIRVYARAYWKGWLRDDRIPPMLERAWQALKTKIWDSCYLGYCVGTSHGLSRQCYLARPHDSFRASRSSILHAWIELQRMRTALNKG